MQNSNIKILPVIINILMSHLLFPTQILLELQYGIKCDCSRNSFWTFLLFQILIKPNL
jgi:hypothetical protein